MKQRLAAMGISSDGTLKTRSKAPILNNRHGVTVLSDEEIPDSDNVVSRARLMASQFSTRAFRDIKNSDAGLISREMKIALAVFIFVLCTLAYQHEKIYVAIGIAVTAIVLYGIERLASSL